MKPEQTNTKSKRPGFLLAFSERFTLYVLFKSRRSAAVFSWITPNKIFCFLVVPLTAVIFSSSMLSSRVTRSPAELQGRTRLINVCCVTIPNTCSQFVPKKVKQASRERRDSFYEFSFRILAFPFKYSSCNGSKFS